MKDEFTEALTPSQAEIDRLLEPLDPNLLGACAEATAPRPHEMARLRPRVRRRSRAPLLLAGALALGLALFALPDAQPVVATAGWTVSEQADIRVLQAEPAIVQVQSGTAVFDVPKGTPLEVRVGDVEVHVLGTHFSVQETDDGVRVEVFEGRVSVRWPEGMTSLVAGSVWVQPAPTVALVERAVRRFEAETTRPETVAAVYPAPVDEPEEPEEPARPNTVEAALTWAVINDRYDLGERDDRLIDDLESWLELYPDHAVHEEAEVVRLELYAVSRPPRMAIAEMEAWLVSNPYSPRRLEVLYRLGHVARMELNDCDRAIRAYQVVAREDEGEMGDLARQWLIHCLDE